MILKRLCRPLFYVVVIIATVVAVVVVVVVVVVVLRSREEFNPRPQTTPPLPYAILLEQGIINH